MALLLAPLLVLVGVSRADAYYLCADAVARTTCCCPSVQAPRGDEPRIAAACCAIEERGAVAPKARSSDRLGAPSVDVPVLVVTTPELPAATIVAVAPLRRAHAPPRSVARASQHVVFLL